MPLHSPYSAEEGIVTELKNDALAKKMTSWAIVALVMGIAGSVWLPDFVVVFVDNLQQAWQILRSLSWVAVQFGLPLSAVLFVGAAIVRRLPERVSTKLSE